MVVALVATLSSIYIAQIVHQRINADYETGVFIGNQVLHATQDALDTDFSSTRLDFNNPDAVRDAIAEALQTDAGVNSLLESDTGYSKVVYDVAITDLQGRALLHTDPSLNGKLIPGRDSFDELLHQGMWRQLQIVYGEPHAYDIRMPLNRAGAPFGYIRIGIQTLFMKNELQPVLNRAIAFSGIAVLVSLVLAAGLSNLAFRPLMAIARQLDLVTGPPVEGENRPRDEVGLVTTRIDRLGRQFRDVKDVFSALKENLDQIMSTLQDGLMLFTRDSRAVLVSASAERFLAQPRGQMLGSSVAQIFSSQTQLGSVVLNAFEGHEAIAAREVLTENGRRLQVSLDFIEEGGERIGALLTMRDAESVRRIESEIELSRRLAAIGRLTSGVAHEVKNPINAIVVHLEILRQKLEEIDPDTRRHMDVIGSEIQRLDRVVQMLVDFTRPVELRLADVDLRRVLDEVAMLASPDAERHGVHIQKQSPPEPLVAKIDADLVKQAVLNVVLNGVQAMEHGGTLRLEAARFGGGAELVVQDSGPGIPPEIREKIFDLYFTTKKAGSGIGLAMTFRVMQLHHGAVEFDSAPGAGATFHLRFPAAGAMSAETEEMAARG